MPEVVAAALTYAGVSGGVAVASAVGPAVVSYAAIAGYAATLVTSIGYSAYARRRAQRSANASLQDRMIPVRASDAPRTIVYGQTRVAGALIYAATHGTKREKLTLVYALAGHELDSFQAHWLGDAPVSLDGSGNVTTAPWSNGEVYADAQSWVGGGVGSTYTITGSDPLLSVDSLAIWSVADIGGEGTSLGRVSEAIPGTAYSVDLPSRTITLSTADYSGFDLIVTFRSTLSTSYAAIKAFRGIAAGERDTALETATAADSAPWTSAHIGRGVPRLHITHTWNETAYASGLPSPTAIVRGKRVYDPRADSTNGGTGSQRLADSTTWAWSANPALCAADYLMDPLGFGVSSSKIDWAYVRTAANVCDEAVPLNLAGTTTQKRYECHGVLSTDATRKSNLEAILASMVGSAYYSGGKWYIRAASYVTPTLDLDESDLSDGGIVVRARAPRAELFNAVRGRFTDPSNLYQVTDFPPYSSATYAAQDGGEVVYEDIDLALVDDATRAQRIAKLILYRSRQALTIDATWKLPALVLQPGDTCRLTIARYGWTDKAFRVLECEFQDGARVRLSLQEESSAIYSWSYDEASNPDPAPNTSLPSPAYVPPPTGVALSYSATTYYRRTDGTAVPYVDITWSAPPADTQPAIFWKRAAEAEYAQILLAVGATGGRIEGVSGGETLNVYVVNVAATGARSAAYWIPTYTAHPDLPVNGQPVAALSANLLRNASLSATAGYWQAITGDATFTASVQREPAYPLIGIPGNGRLQINSTATGTGKYAIAASAPVPIEPGTRYAAYADVIGWGVDAFVAIEWLVDAVPSGAVPSNVNGNTIAGVAIESSTARPSRLDHYSRSLAIGAAPADARYARVLIVAGGTWAASDAYGAKYLFFARPFFGAVPAGVVDSPPWDPGGAPISDTTDIAAGAATTIYRTGASGALFSEVDYVSRVPGSSTWNGELTGPAFVASTDGQIEVAVQLSARVTAPSANPIYVRAQLQATTGAPMVGAWQDTMVVPASTTSIEAHTIVATFDVAAGQSVAIILYLYRGAAESFGADGIVEKVVSPSFNKADRVYDARWRATYIKR